VIFILHHLLFAILGTLRQLWSRQIIAIMFENANCTAIPNDAATDAGVAGAGVSTPFCVNVC
jgi:hypothetical protein